jgi:hypothetical protein
MMDHGMAGMGVYLVLFTVLLVALLVLAVTATVWLIRNMMRQPGVGRAESEGPPAP